MAKSSKSTKYQIVFQYLVKYFPGPLDYIFLKRTANHLNIRQKGKSTSFPPT